MSKASPPAEPFAIVRDIGLRFPEVEATTKYDGSPVLKLGGCFMAGLAAHPSAEAGTLVVRMAIDDRQTLLEDAPEIYYVMDYYRPYPIVLARLAHLDAAALRDLLSVSWRLTAVKSRSGGRVRRGKNPVSAKQVSPTWRRKPGA